MTSEDASFPVLLSSGSSHRVPRNLMLPWLSSSIQRRIWPGLYLVGAPCRTTACNWVGRRWCDTGVAFAPVTRYLSLLLVGCGDCGGCASGAGFRPVSLPFPLVSFGWGLMSRRAGGGDLPVLLPLYTNVPSGSQLLPGWGRLVLLLPHSLRNGRARPATRSAGGGLDRLILASYPGVIRLRRNMYSTKVAAN